MPVINENDTTATDEISFGDNDILAAQVAILMSADLLVVLSDVDGLYTSDPGSDPDAAARARGARPRGAARATRSGCRSSHIGSGGMRSKVLCAEMATSAGIPVVICNGTAAGHAAARRRGRAGRDAVPSAGAARVELQAVAASTRRASRGTVLVDAGAERALREQGTSLLPVGVVDVEGDFEAGDAVDVAAAGDGRRPIGKGISNYSAEELRRVKGLKSAQVREVLPRASEEAVHRDYFVLA